MVNAWWEALIPVHGFPVWWLWLLWAVMPLQITMFGAYLYAMHRLTRNCHE